MPASSPRKLHSRSTTGHRGVHYHPVARKFEVRLMVRGVRHYLGLFPTLEEAVAVAEAAYAGDIPTRPAKGSIPTPPHRRQWDNPLPEAELIRLRRLAAGFH